jgi:beta-lactamase class A
MITRRHVATGICVLGAGLRLWHDAAHASGLSHTLTAELATIERESGGRLGVAVLDTLSGARAGHRVDERFPMCSTFKLLAAAAVLKRADTGAERLDRRVRIEATDLLSYAPVTKTRAGADMTIMELCEAAMIVSDNTAANLLLATLGGPAGLTEFARALGDTVTRLDRIEPELNEAIPGDPRDTTSPAAMASNLRALTLGDALAPSSREKLTAWLVANKTGDARLRAGLPRDWRVAEKTGTGERGTANDVGLAWPPSLSLPSRGPIIVTAYLTGAIGAGSATRCEPGGGRARGG